MADTLKDKSIQLSHGGGGKEMNKLIRDLFLPNLITQSFVAKKTLPNSICTAPTPLLLTLLPSHLCFLPAAISANLLSRAQSTISL